MKPDDLLISQNAVKWIKQNKKYLQDKYCDLSKYPPVEVPVSLFMAGSPGAGKTEFSKRFNDQVVEQLKEIPLNAVRIDADEIRDEIEGYSGNNSELYQSAASLGVEKLFDFSQRKHQNLILDGTFADLNKSCNNIERSLGRKRLIGIFYIYQDPIVAWHFIKEREKLDGRSVPKQVFIDALFAAKDNVINAKRIFGKNVELNVIVKNPDNYTEKSYFNVDTIDSFVKIRYDDKSLQNLLVE